jgi:hypothetical protein
VNENAKNSKDAQAGSVPLPWRRTAMLAAILAVLQACMTINGRGIEGFVLWILIFFVGYWLLFTFLVWLWRYLRRRS